MPEPTGFEALTEYFTILAQTWPKTLVQAKLKFPLIPGWTVKCIIADR